MIYNGLAIVWVLFGLIALFFAVKVLLKAGWVLGWIRGMFGLIIVFLGVSFAMVAFDIFSYQQILNEQSVATINFKRLEPQKYAATLVRSDGTESEVEISGDQWQVDARIIKWSGFIGAWGVKPGYRLDRLSGRYYSLEDERAAERSVYALTESHLGVDVWHWLNQNKSVLPWIDTIYGSATYLPMEEDALFEIRLSNSGLLARPLNEPAEQAVKRWQ